MENPVSPATIPCHLAVMAERPRDPFDAKRDGRRPRTERGRLAELGERVARQP